MEDLQDVDLGEEKKKEADKEDEDSVDLDVVEGEPVQQAEPAAQKTEEPLIPGDIQGAEIKAYLSKRMEEDKEDSTCCDCTENKKSTHANVSFGTFICSDCANIH